jgi:hypothetical protein
MHFTVIIATSQKRTEWLIERSLSSVYNQIGIDNSNWSVYIIDDNEVETEFTEIQNRIETLRNNLQLKKTEFTTTVLKNTRTRFMSGTGAWNTGIIEAHKLYPNGFVSILDDDDEYLPTHLFDCTNEINKNTVAVLQRMNWQNEDKSTMNVDLTKEKLTAENFFIGNPGVQGSNMFFRTQNLMDIDGFDETLPNTTDRDIMIRFLWENDVSQIKVLENIGIVHYNHNQSKVNNDIPRKQQGLNLFYQKYKVHFSEEDYKKSLTRAKKYFSYNPVEERFKEQIVICMPLKNAVKSTEDAVFSLLQQKGTKREIILLIGNDGSTDGSQALLKEIAFQNPNVVVLNVNFGKVSLNRNFLNDYVRENYPNCILIGRLDADDVIFSESTIRQVEKLFDEHNFDVLMCGNKQVKSGIVLNGENKPSENLLEDQFLLNQVFEMSQGNPKAELPSCNTFIKPTIKIEYPDKASAEDHWFTVFLLLQKEQLNILIDEQLLYCFYSLDGDVTATNKKNKDYTQSREDLYRYLNLQNSLKTVHDNWSNYIRRKGLVFHENNIQNNKERLEKLWRLDYPLNERIGKILKRINKQNIRLLDIGCGPFPKSGLSIKDFTIDRTLIDPMADNYHELLEENNIETFGQKIIKWDAETIDEKFKKNSIEIIFSRNALDHMYNPIEVLSKSLDIITSDGMIVLEHYIKEGEYTSYYGLHQWDFYINNGSFYISNREKNIIQNINSLFKNAQIESFYEGNKIINIINKL